MARDARPMASLMWLARPKRSPKRTAGSATAPTIKRDHAGDQPNRHTVTQRRRWRPHMTRMNTPNAKTTNCSVGAEAENQQQPDDHRDDAEEDAQLGR